MSVKIVTKGFREEPAGNSQHRMAHHHCTVQKPIVFHDYTKPSPLLFDKNEFPSLTESSGVTSNTFCLGRTLRYSDKLKSSSSSRNESTTAECFNSQNSSRTNVYDQCRNKNSKDENWKHIKRDSIASVKNVNEGDSNKSQSKKIQIGSSANLPKKLQNERFKERNSVPKPLSCDQGREKNPADTFKNLKRSTSNKAPVSGTNASSTIKQSHSCSLPASGNNAKEAYNQDGQNDSKAKKKKRKSKLKRQAGLQSGKITVLTPEVHLKILNQTSALNVSSSKAVLTDINDEEEYPVLGKTMCPSNRRDISLKKEITLMPLQENIQMHLKVLSEDKGVIHDSPVCSINESPVKEKNDTKMVHLKDPITLSFYDMLLSKNTKLKVRAMKDETDARAAVESSKIQIKKITGHPHNLLDSSSPMIKRGKEREKPKPKKPSMLKKIILSDRKARKEQFLLFKSNNIAESPAIGHEFYEDIKKEVIENRDVPEENYVISPCQVEKIPDAFPFSDNDESSQDELNSIIEKSNVSEPVEVSDVGLSHVNCFSENINPDICLENSKANALIDEVLSNEKESFIKPEESLFGPVSSSDVILSDSLLRGLINNVVKSEPPHKERAAKILLHTRNFREYCNHLISKDIDDAVYALLDDLARFQDRLHQKDPIKARMKKRMIYGVKEVKKHIKMRKLKCIIIAVDIENVESQGGLNDVLNEIKSLAADHHIPCVFALSRKALGKVCHKPVPVSCVGVFNFEGSEVNFRKMVELQTQSKADYNEFFNKLFLKLTEAEAASLLKAKKEAPETLHSIRENILDDFFLQSKVTVIKSYDDSELNVKQEDET